MPLSPEQYDPSGFYINNRNDKYYNCLNEVEKLYEDSKKLVSGDNDETLLKAELEFSKEQCGRKYWNGAYVRPRPPMLKENYYCKEEYKKQFLRIFRKERTFLDNLNPWIPYPGPIITYNLLEDYEHCTELHPKVINPNP